jgi:hypothetical protein
MVPFPLMIRVQPRGISITFHFRRPETLSSLSSTTA